MERAEHAAGRGGRRRAIAAAALLLAAVVPGSAPAAGELVLVERRGCPYCQRWLQEVAPIYARAPEAEAAPLRRLDIGAVGQAGLSLRAPVVFTPTFLVVDDDGREIGRVTGYIDDASFWGLLAPLVAKLPRPSAAAPADATTAGAP